LGDISIDEDDLSDDYDFMDDDEEAAERRRQERQEKRMPQLKYKNVLKKLANRAANEIVIDLDDLATVCLLPLLSTTTASLNV
jgi:DNA replication licensing factor MCM7